MSISFEDATHLHCHSVTKKSAHQLTAGDHYEIAKKIAAGACTIEADNGELLFVTYTNSGHGTFSLSTGEEPHESHRLRSARDLAERMDLQPVTQLRRTTDRSPGATGAGPKIKTRNTREITVGARLNEGLIRFKQLAEARNRSAEEDKEMNEIAWHISAMVTDKIHGIQWPKIELMQ